MLTQNQLCALSSDLLARGILSEELLDGIEIIDYTGFVNLTIEHSVIQSWD
jgi:tRNA 2-thiouridine synthesizing protein B